MATAKDEFLVRFRYWLVSGGMMTRMAWGSSTWRVVCQLDRPMLRAASNWPRGTDTMPARTTSATKAEV